MNKYSVVIPCYKSAPTIGKVVSLTAEELRRLDIQDFEFILVNDCSPDGGETIRTLQGLAEEFPFVKVVDLGKNAGQHNATMAGLQYAAGDYIISMDDDMQTHPSQLGKLKEKLEEGYDIVYGYYTQKKESLFRRLGSALNYWTVRLLIQKPRWLRTSSFWMIRRYVRDYVIQYRHPHVHLQGLFLRTTSTSNIACVPIEHFEREYGSSTYTLKKLIQLYSNIIGYSVTPLKIVTNIGYIFAAMGFVIDAIVLIRKLLHPEFAAGWTSMIGALCFFSGVILVALGVVGGYVGRLFIGETNTPQYVVRDLINVENDIRVMRHEEDFDSGRRRLSGAAH